MMRSTFILFLCFLVSCGGGYTAVVDVPSGGWSTSEWVEFDLGRGNGAAQIDIVVGHDYNFAQGELLLEVKTTQQGADIFWSDTIVVPLVDHRGQWRGRQMGSRLDVRQVYRTGVQFVPSYRYTVALRQLNQDTLTGVEYIGLEIKN